MAELDEKIAAHFRTRGSRGADRLEIAVGDERLELPGTVAHMLRDIVSALARGDMVTLLPSHRELTTQEAADILNVSRTYLIRLLDEGQIAYTRVHKHRRIRADELMRFKERRDAARREGLRQMTRDAQKMGDYFGKKTQ